MATTSSYRRRRENDENRHPSRSSSNVPSNHSKKMKFPPQQQHMRNPGGSAARCPERQALAGMHPAHFGGLQHHMNSTYHNLANYHGENSHQHARPSTRNSAIYSQANGDFSSTYHADQHGTLKRIGHHSDDGPPLRKFHSEANLWRTNTYDPSQQHHYASGAANSASIRGYSASRHMHEGSAHPHHGAQSGDYARDHAIYNLGTHHQSSGGHQVMQQHLEHAKSFLSSRAATRFPNGGAPQHMSVMDGGHQQSSDPGNSGVVSGAGPACSSSAVMQQGGAGATSATYHSYYHHCPPQPPPAPHQPHHHQINGHHPPHQSEYHNHPQAGGGGPGLGPHHHSAHHHHQQVHLQQRVPGSYQHNVMKSRSTQSTEVETPTEEDGHVSESCSPAAGKRDDAGTVREYEASLFAYLREQEQQYKVDAHKLKGQVNVGRRAALVDWLVQVHAKHNLREETLFITISILDRFIEKQPIVEATMQLVGMACLLIASKYEDIHPPRIEDLLRACEKKHTKGAVLQMEIDVLNALEFRIPGVLPLEFLRRLLRLAPDYANAPQSNAGELYRETQYNLALFILELAMIDGTIFSAPDASAVAASALYFARQLMRVETVWTPQMDAECRSGSKALYKAMSALWLASHKTNFLYAAIPRKFSDRKWRSVAGRFRNEDLSALVAPESLKMNGGHHSGAQPVGQQVSSNNNNNNSHHNPNSTSSSGSTSNIMPASGAGPLSSSSACSIASAIASQAGSADVGCEGANATNNNYHGMSTVSVAPSGVGQTLTQSQQQQEVVDHKNDVKHLHARTRSEVDSDDTTMSICASKTTTTHSVNSSTCDQQHQLDELARAGAYGGRSRRESAVESLGRRSMVVDSTPPDLVVATDH